MVCTPLALSGSPSVQGVEGVPKEISPSALRTWHLPPENAALGCAEPPARIRESLKLGKASKVINSSLQLNTPVPTEPFHEVPHPALQGW